MLKIGVKWPEETFKIRGHQLKNFKVEKTSKWKILSVGLIRSLVHLWSGDRRLSLHFR